MLFGVRGLRQFQAFSPVIDAELVSEFRDSLCSVDRISGKLVGVEKLSPLDVAVYIVRVFVGDAEVIVDVSFVVGASPSTASEGSDRIGIIKGPANTVRRCGIPAPRFRHQRAR